MEHFRSWGLAEQLRAARTMPPGHPIGTVVAYGDLMSDFWHAPPGREQVAEYFVERNERLPQYRTEEVLRRPHGRARRHGGLVRVDGDRGRAGRRTACG